MIIQNLNTPGNYIRTPIPLYRGDIRDILPELQAMLALASQTLVTCIPANHVGVWVRAAVVDQQHHLLPGRENTIVVNPSWDVPWRNRKAKAVVPVTSVDPLTGRCYTALRHKVIMARWSDADGNRCTQLTNSEAFIFQYLTACLDGHPLMEQAIKQEKCV